MTATTETAAVAVGDLVRIERDETVYPSRGTWPEFRGRTGTLIEINLGEYGVVFGKVMPRTDGRGRFIRSGNEPVTWFQPYELTQLRAGKAPQHAESAGSTRARMDDTEETAA